MHRLFSLLLCLPLVLLACDASDPEAEIEIVEIVTGTGAVAARGDLATVRYTGSRTDGFVFDSGTYTFRLGRGEAIEGFDRGVEGMRVGGKRRITIPPSLGYGNQPVRDPQTGETLIPANSTLIFDIELMSVTKPG